jgi:hypothetical protein
MQANVIPDKAFINAIGLAMFASGWALKNLALRANAFAVTVVRLKSELGHVVSTADHTAWFVIHSTQPIH